MSLISRYTYGKTKKQKMTKEQLVGIIDSDAKFLDEREDIVSYIDSLQVGSGLGEEEIKKGYEEFKAQKSSSRLGELALKYGIDKGELTAFVELTIGRMIFDAEQLGDLFAAQGLGWKERGKKESALMEELIPLLKKLAGDNEISGLKAYE
jgi:type I restriction enzyme R subunit